jgi:hypothetical protein
MTEKAKERHANALRSISVSLFEQEWMWDKELLRASKSLVNATTASHTIRSRTHSLLSLIRTHIDPALDQWTKKKQLVLPWKFSEIIQMDRRQGHDCLVLMGMQGREDWFVSDEISKMADLLIFLHSFCAAHTSETVKKIYLDPKRRQSAEELPERVGKGLRIGARSNSRQLEVPVHLKFSFDLLLDRGLCQACGDPTAARIEYEVVTDHASKVEVNLKKQIAAGIEFASKTKGSRYFCPAHSERDAGSDAYKKGRAQVELFLSLLLALNFCGVARHLNNLFPVEWNIPFAKKAIRSTICKPDLHLVAERMSDLRSGQLDEAASDEAKVDIYRAIHRMFFDHLKMTPIAR